MSIYDELEESIKQSIKTQKHQEASEYLAPLISKEIGEAMKPYMDRIAESSNRTNEAISNIKLEAPIVNVAVPNIEVPSINVPEVKLPQINIPEIKVPDVRIPEIKIPKITVPRPKVTVNIPETKYPNFPTFPEFPSEMSLRGVGLATPLPVQLRDADGKPFSFPAQSFGGGGKIDNFTIKGINDSAWGSLINADGRLRIESNDSITATGEGVSNSSTIRTVQATDSINSVNVTNDSIPVTQSGGWTVTISDPFSTTSSNLVNPDNRLKVELPTGSSGLTDTELRASSVPVSQVSGANWSVSAIQSGDWSINQVSGAINSVNLLQVAGTAVAVDSGVTGAGVQRIVHVTDVAMSVRAISNSGVDIGDVDILSIAAGDNNIGNVDVVTLPALVAGTANIGDVDVLTMPTTTVTGTVAHDAVDSGNPQKIGFRAVAHSTNPTAVAAGDRTDWLANRAGIPWVIGGHPNIITRRDNFTTAQTDVALVTVATGLKIVVTKISALADNANTVDVQVRVGFGATTTPTGAGVVLSHPGIAAGSGVIEGSGSGILGVGADGEDLRITSEVPTSGSIDILTSYYTIES